MEKQTKGWAVLDKKTEKLTYITLVRGNYTIAPSCKKQYKPIQILITYKTN